ncbi:MAG: glycosyl hydrolase [Bacteroidota bacterium]
MKNLFYLLLLLPLLSTAQMQPTNPIAATTAAERIAALDARKALQENSLVANLPFESVGPSVFSGRVTDIEVSPNDPTHFYVAYASGGLWKTTNNGMSFEPLFEEEIVMTIGDLAVDWERNTIWLGSGEVNSSRSSYAGVGMYKSEDGGKTWTHKGLEESHHIGRVVLHPSDPNTLWVAVLGHLYSPNEERGIYKTTDGGATWKKTLYAGEDAGAVDLLIDRQNPNVLYAATWERTRRAWNFVESGEASGIYKSTDGGDNWTLLSTEKSGFPVGKGVGRIGLAMNGSSLYAILDNYDRRPKEEEEEEKELLSKEDFREMDKANFLALDKEKLQKFLKSNRFPEKYTAESVLEMVKKDQIKPIALVEYLETANSLLFDTPVIGAEVYRSEDGGATWEKTHDKYLDAVYNSYGYYFGQIRVAPDDKEKIYIMGVPVLRSDDGGKNWVSINGSNVHSDHHDLWISPNRSGHLILGNDGGINISYDDGKTWNKCNSPAVGQFYTVAVDEATPYNIYGGLQDNGVWKGAHTYQASERWHGTGQYPYKSIMGGDGMQVAIDTRDNATVYTGFQFGNYFRINTQTGARQYITPKHELGDRPLRWNWQAPIHLSVHNQDIFYMGSHKLHRSFNQGDDFEAISDDLTTGGRKGDVAFSTLTSIHESPLRFGLLYTGSDDGLIHVSKDGGHSWQMITKGLPKDLWVSRVQASQHEESVVYASLNAYRWDDFEAYVYRSEDYGSTWKRIGTDLPLEPVNVIKEDPTNPNLLYVGTDHGLYISLNQGETFMAMDETIPAVAVHDLVVQQQAKHLVLGTHGRSFYIANVKELQQLQDSILEKDLHTFAIAETRHSSRWGNAYAWWYETEEPEMQIPYFTKAAGEVAFSIAAKEQPDFELYTWSKEVPKGLNYETYHFHLDEAKIEKMQQWLKGKDKDVKLEKADNGKYYLPKGEYVVKLKKGKTVKEEALVLN